MVRMLRQISTLTVWSVTGWVTKSKSFPRSSPEGLRRRGLGLEVKQRWKIAPTREITGFGNAGDPMRGNGHSLNEYGALKNERRADFVRIIILVAKIQSRWASVRNPTPEF